MMNLPLKAPPADNAVSVELRWSEGDRDALDSVIPGASYHIQITGLPENAYYALRVSENAGVFSSLNATLQQTTVGCAGQLISIAGVGASGAASAMWTAPASGFGSASHISFALAWSLGPQTPLPPSASPGVFFIEKNMKVLPTVSSRGEMGETSVEVTVAIDDEAGATTMIVSGPSGKWFAVGFGETTMKGYAVVVDETQRAHERSMVGIGNVGTEDLAATVEIVRIDANASTGTTIIILSTHGRKNKRILLV